MITKQINNFTCKNLTSSNNMIDVSSLIDGDIIKLGYCCDAIGTDPTKYISLRLKGHSDWINIQIGPTGIYEYQPETIMTEDGKEEIKIYVSGIKVPTGVDFVLDLVLED